MSYSWLIPTMLTFMSSAADTACDSAVTAAGVQPQPLTARQEMLMMLTVVPSMVWGLRGRDEARTVRATIE
jgi:hypothetical protein